MSINYNIFNFVLNYTIHHSNLPLYVITLKRVNDMMNGKAP